MKRIIFMLIAIIAMASCKKSDFITMEEDEIKNQVTNAIDYISINGDVLDINGDKMDCKFSYRENYGYGHLSIDLTHIISNDVVENGNIKTITTITDTDCSISIDYDLSTIGKKTDIGELIGFNCDYLNGTIEKIINKKNQYGQDSCWFKTNIDKNQLFKYVYLRYDEGKLSSTYLKNVTFNSEIDDSEKADSFESGWYLVKDMPNYKMLNFSGGIKTHNGIKIEFAFNVAR